MSGHSKWHNIQKTKGAQDAKRAAAFTKISKEMIETFVSGMTSLGFSKGEIINLIKNYHE